jgi:hypothetical protein
MGDLLEMGFVAEDVFDNSTCTCHLGQKSVPLAAGGIK